MCASVHVSVCMHLCMCQCAWAVLCVWECICVCACLPVWGRTRAHVQFLGTDAVGPGPPFETSGLHSPSWVKSHPPSPRAGQRPESTAWWYSGLSPGPRSRSVFRSQAHCFQPSGLLGAARRESAPRGPSHSPEGGAPTLRACVCVLREHLVAETTL